MKSHFTSYDLMRPLRSAARHYQLDIQEDCQRKWIDFQDGNGKGSLTVYDFEDGVQALFFNGSLPEDWEWNTTSKKESPFLMLFNVRGKMEFSYGGLPEPMTVNPLKTLLIAHPPGQDQIVRINGHEPTMFLMINLERKLYIHHIECLPEPVQNEVSRIFSGKTAIKIFLNSQYGLEGAAIGQQLASDDKVGLIHVTFIEAKVLELFSIQLRRWENEIHGNNPQKAALRTGDVEKIILARNYLIENIQEAPTIEELSKKAGVNRQKLKQGFKIVFGKTVNEYLRNERLKLARQLLSQSQYSIKEISSRVGYENASYFARRFKSAYGLYPNEYAAAAIDHSEEE